MAAYNLRSELSDGNNEDNGNREKKAKIRYDNDSMLNIRKIYW